MLATIIEITAPVISAVEKDSGGDGVGDTLEINWLRKRIMVYVIFARAKLS